MIGIIIQSKILIYLESYNYMDIISKRKKLKIKKLSKSIFIYLLIYIVIYFSSQFILNCQGLVYLQWFQYVSYTIIGLGIMAGTFQWIVIGYKTDHFRIKVGVMLLIIEIVVALGMIIVFYTFNNRELIVDKDGITMVEEKPNFSFTNWSNYYDYQNMFVRKNIVRIRVEYGESSNEYTSIDYYDEDGAFIKNEIK